MRNKTKPKDFIKESYDRNNQWGIEKFSTFLISKDYTINQKEEDYSIDISAIKNGEEYLFEIEVKTGYPFISKDTFKFPTVSFLARKEKWKSKGFWYIIICRETEHFLACHSSVIFQEIYKEEIYVDSYERKGLDEFYRVPKDLCYFSKLL